jgi:hypothetical protein
VKIEPRLADAGPYWGPIHDYYVVFWRQPRIPSSELPEGVTQERVVWAAAEHYVREAEDVHAVLAWAEEEARRRRAMYMLHAVIVTSGREGLVWLAGVNPTSSGDTFARRHPPDVDPVGGTPTEVYGPLDES